MRWSYSASRSFSQCQRQWFFKNIAANARAQDPIRRRAHLLSKLQSISAWRGKIVDAVISEYVVRNVSAGSPVTLNQAKRLARRKFDAQLACAHRHPIADPHCNIADEGKEFAVFHVREYSGQIPQEEVDQAWLDIEQALTNLFTSEEAKAPLKQAKHCIAQRALHFPLFEGASAISYPDVIAFQTDSSVAIVDWKVHSFGTNDAWKQLGVYAIALARSNPHKDFPTGFSKRPEEVILIETQLLGNSVREHRLDEDRIAELEGEIIESAYEMTCLTEGKKYEDLDIGDFRTAIFPETCERCAFRRVCWGESDGH